MDAQSERLLLCKQFVDSILENESPEVRNLTAEIATLLAFGGYNFTPDVVRALKLIHSYAAFTSGLRK